MFVILIPLSLCRKLFSVDLFYSLFCSCLLCVVFLVGSPAASGSPTNLTCVVDIMVVVVSFLVHLANRPADYSPHLPVLCHHVVWAWRALVVGGYLGGQGSRWLGQNSEENNDNDDLQSKPVPTHHTSHLSSSRS